METSSGNQPQPTTPVSADTDVSSPIALLLYGLSIPERSARTVSAVVGGLANESAARLIPSAFRTSKSYTVFIQQSLDFMIRDVGGVASDAELAKQAVEGEDVSEEQAEGMLARQAVGGMVDFAGMATLHLSPMTLLAIISDVAYGSSTYVRELSDELKRQGVIDGESTIDHVSDLIDALQESSSQGADAFNAPPVNVQGLKETISKTREALNRIDPVNVIPQGEIERMWGEMQQTANENNSSIFDVATTMTMFSMNRLSLVTRGALSSVTVAGNMIDQHILSHYADALTEIQVRGLWSTLSTASVPYYAAIWDNFDETKSTLTEDLLTGKLIANGWTSLSRWWNDSEKEPEQP